MQISPCHAGCTAVGRVRGAPDVLQGGAGLMAGEGLGPEDGDKGEFAAQALNGRKAA